MSESTAIDELRSTFLFEDLSAAQLSELAARGTVVRVDAGEVVFEEGEPADHLWVLLSGRVRIVRRLQDHEVDLTTMDRPGSWGGGLRAFGPAAADSGYRGTGRALEPTRLFRLPSSELAALLTEWLPLGKHLLDGIFQTVRGIEALVRQRESLVALGTLAAGLAHELNNPASAAAQAVDTLGSRLSLLSDALVRIDRSAAAPGTVASLLDRATAGAAAAASGANARLRPLERSEREQAVAAALAELAIVDRADLAASLVAAGGGPELVHELTLGLGPEAAAAAVLAVGAHVGTFAMLSQTREALARITEMLDAVRLYSQLDRAPEQDVDVRVGIDSTVKVLSHAFGAGVTVERDDPAHLPMVDGHPGELNQVWTNILGNAVDAMDGSGTIRISTRADGGDVVVEFADDGPGVPPEILGRVFEPFFTTKPVGAGSGLGLDITRRIVERHRGTITIDSRPGATTVRVRLPAAHHATP